MTIHVTGLTQRTIRLGNIDADWAASNSLYYFVQFEVLEAEDSQVAIVACNYDPMFSASSPHPKRGNVIDLATIEAKDHVRVDVYRQVLVIPDNIVKASM